MTFYIGAMLGFSIGSVIVSIIFIYLLAKATRGNSDTNTKLYEYWEHSMEFQRQQVEELGKIASSQSQKIVSNR